MIKSDKIKVSYFGSRALFLNHNGFDKSQNQIELFPLQTFRNHQNLNITIKTMLLSI